MRYILNFFKKILWGILYVIYKVFLSVYAILSVGLLVALGFLIFDIVQARTGIPFTQTKFFMWTIYIVGAYFISAFFTWLTYPYSSFRSFKLLVKMVFFG